MNTIYHKLVKLLQSGAKIQTGSLLYTKGSAPQVPGAMAIFEGHKVIGGTLGGGLLEAEAQKVAASSSENQKNNIQLVQFNAEINDKSGAICGGSALFYIDANPGEHLDTFLKLVDSLNKRRCGTLITLIKSSKKHNYNLERFWVEQNSRCPETISAIFTAEKIDIQKIIHSRKSVWIESVGEMGSSQDENVSLFIEPVHPIPQLIIVGAGHIGQALCKVSSLVDFEIIVVDDRPELAKKSRFPGATQIICNSLSEAFREIAITADSYIVLATQGHRTDIEALKCCITSNAAYIGVIGSKRKTNLMREEFITKKWATPEELDSIHAPIGIDIHSKSINEIAISIVAELVKERFEINFRRTKKMISSIVLAAGKSTRMGSQKLLLPFDGKSMVRLIVDKIEGSNSNQTVVVIGSHKNEIKEVLKGCDVLLIENERFEEGMLSSVQIGVKSVSAETDGILVLLGDQPMVSEMVINRLISVFQKTQKGLIVPTFNGKRGHPVLINSKYRDKIETLNPEIGLRELFLNNTDDILEIEVDTENILKDIDTPKDYKREIK